MQPIQFDDVDLRLAIMDVPPPANIPVVARCPMKEKHRDSEPSLRVYPDNIHCYGCGFHLGRRQLYASFALLFGWWNGHGDDYQAAMRVKFEVDISKYYRTAVEAYRERAREDALKKPMPKQTAQLYHRFLLKERRNRLAPFLKKRAIEQQTVEDFEIGHDGTRYTIPLYSPTHDLLTIRFRRDDRYDTEGPKYSGVNGRNGLFLFPMDKLAEVDSCPLYVVEGELDAVTLWSRGIPAVSPTNGAGQVKHVVRLLQHVFPEKFFGPMLLYTDQDEPGEQAARELAEACDEAGIGWYRGRWGMEQGKDITEYLRNGGRLSNVRHTHSF